MRIAILGATNIKHMSLLSHYLNHIDLNINEVDIIYTDKYDIEEHIQGINNYYKYKVDIKEDWTFIKKTIAYYRFRPYAMKILKENRYDFVIVWGSYTGHLFKSFLEKHYKNKFILNIRDYFFENNKLIKYRMKKIVDASRVTTLSSEGFLKFLPKSEKYRIIYSYNMSIIRESNVTDGFKKRWPINIGFIGNVRFNEINQKLIKELANDSRFHMQYFGTGSEKLEVFARENFINNITFSGGFDLKETPKYLNEIDILNNLFGNQNIALDTALSIRMYYALFLNKPIITTDDTFTATEANKFGLGFSINPENLKGIGDELMDWYNNLDVMDINHKREAYRNDVIENNKQFYQEIGRIFNE
ncbi:capsular polysaccharide synthesis enzyme Cap8H [Staphylococcus aureus]|uniref:type 8 capsular polysaccharide synthesis protein Cap8H n=1 Tax=Staphylococcus aureus TaxID=1280 RepID=UPI000E3BA0BE|nr:type 8 capsular polysaccharide synthesis protein Cap8H [Staphylococcus aureus]GBW54701.1 capsular polysaccharide synthesis enzyme Cap8H [Staphylococcus aureus]GBZ69370.1 capsular polysaccharide synthesis enzyme Cap8H [Staphylococcus aureus]